LRAKNTVTFLKVFISAGLWNSSEKANKRASLPGRGVAQNLPPSVLKEQEFESKFYSMRNIFTGVSRNGSASNHLRWTVPAEHQRQALLIVILHHGISDAKCSLRALPHNSFLPRDKEALRFLRNR